MAAEGPAGGLEHDLTGEGVPVGVQSAGAHRDQRISRADPIRAEERVRFDDSGGRAREVVLVGAEQSGMLGGLSAEKGAAGDDARFGDALDDLGDALRYDLAAGDVVGHEERLGAADDKIVDEHAD